MPIINQVVKGSGGSAPSNYISLSTDGNGKLTQNANIVLTPDTDIGENVFFNFPYILTGNVDLSAIKSISGTYGCRQMCDYSQTTITSVDLSNLTTVSGDGGCQEMFKSCTSLTSFNLSSLTTVSGNGACNNMFYGCTGITNVDLSSLTSVSGNSSMYYSFSRCTGITNVDLHSLSSILGTDCCRGMFSSCTALTSVDLHNLTTVSGQNAFAYAFNGCTGLTSIYLPKISDTDNASRQNIMSSAFSNCMNLTVADLRYLEYCGNYGIFDSLFNAVPNLAVLNLNSLEHIGTEGARGILYIGSGTSSTLTDLYFPMLTTFGTNPFYTNAFTGRENLTIHFRKDVQATVEALANYSTLWGAGTGSTVVFDLAGTLTGADSNSYTRSEIDSVYASETAGAAKTATAWKYNNVVYYTSGGSEPSVSDAIYSDAACTQSVTTITAIS